MTEYMKFLRGYAGHQPVLQCGASVIVENETGELLLQLRADNHCWGYPGGSVELGESVEEAAKRELFEETGLVAEELELFSVFSGKELHYIYPNGDEVHNIDIVYLCKKYHGCLVADAREVKQLVFFAPGSLPVNLSPPVRIPLQKYLEMFVHT